MLLRFRFANFRSFRDEQELSLVSGPFADGDKELITITGIKEKLIPLAAVYGANASGKTNILKALSFVRSAVLHSHRRWEPEGPIPHEPFALDDSSRGRVSEFELDFILDGVRHQYGFSADGKTIHKEWLDVYPNGKRQSWFLRTMGKSIRFGTKMPGGGKAIEAQVRSNSLFLSAAAQNNHEALTKVYGWFSRVLSVLPTSRGSSLARLAEFCARGEHRDTLLAKLSAADLGIDRLEVNKRDIPPEVRKAVVALFNALNSEAPESKASPLQIEPEESRHEVRLLHRAGSKSISLDLEEESNGTVAYLALLSELLPVLSGGGVLLVDELDASLHPLLALEIMRLVKSSASSPHPCQLVFNTHDTNLLSEGILRRGEIWLVEKKKDGTSVLYPLSDFRPRKDANLGSGYLQGRYGGIPFINSQAFTDCFGTAHAAKK